MRKISIVLISFFLLLFSAKTIFAANTQTLYTFTGGGSNGANPLGSLVESGGKFYGMTSTGGDSNLGVIYSVNTDGTGFTLLQEFSGAANGSTPNGDLIVSGGKLYGMTSAGGSSGSGVIFSLNTDGTSFTLLHEFAGGGSDGSSPYGSLILSGGVLYGMTLAGGDGNKGVIFSINTNGTGFALLHEFAGGGSDGNSPYGSLLELGGKFYGVTYQGGDTDYGVIFSINTNGTGFALLHEFSGAGNGDSPYDTLITTGGKLYGMTAGDNGGGSIIYSINTGGTGFSVMHTFAGGASDGVSPYYNSLFLTGGVMYGTTTAGGDANKGVIFSINPDGTSYSVLHEFAGASDGSSPDASFIESNGSLYSTAYSGGSSNKGLIFYYTIPVPTSTPTPTPTPSSGGGGGGGSSSGSSSGGPTSCTGVPLSQSPNLFQASTTKNGTTIYFSPVAGATNYSVSYGLGSNTNQYGVMTNQGASSGVLSFTINSLSSNSIYSFNVAAQKGCVGGPVSNTITVKTGQNRIFYKNIVSQIISAIAPMATTNLKSTKIIQNNNAIQGTPVPAAVKTNPQRYVQPTSKPIKTAQVPKKSCILFVCW